MPYLQISCSRNFPVILTHKIFSIQFDSQGPMASYINKMNLCKDEIKINGTNWSWSWSSARVQHKVRVQRERQQSSRQSIPVPLEGEGSRNASNKKTPTSESPTNVLDEKILPWLCDISELNKINLCKDEIKKNVTN